MLALTHAVISLPFAFYFENLVLIFIAAFLFHLLADTLLHWNLFPDQAGKYFWPLVAVDVFGGLVISWLLVGELLFTVPLLAAIAGGLAPDVLHAFWEMLGKKKQRHWLPWAIPYFRFHEKLQLETPQVLPGLVWQIVLLVSSATLVAAF